MKTLFLLLALLAFDAVAQTLQEILELQKNDNKTKSTLAYTEAMHSQNALLESYDAPWLSGGVAYSKEGEKKGGEFTLTFSQELTNPFDSSKKASLQKSLKNSLELEQMYNLSQRELSIAQKYYSACVSKLTLKQSQQLQKKQLQKIKELEYAYSLGEISKKELLFSKLDLAKLSKETHNYNRVYTEEFALLEQSLSGMALSSLSCSDLVPPKRHQSQNNKRHHRALESLEYKQQATLQSYELYDSFLPKMQYQILYEQELSMERITLGLSIPLTQLTHRQELLKAEQLKKNMALGYEREALKSELEQSLQKKEKLLRLLYDEYQTQKDEILPLSHELLELADYAYKEGEGSLMEYLDAWRSYEESSIELLKIQKSYYEALFAFYKISDSNYGAIE